MRDFVKNYRYTLCYIAFVVTLIFVFQLYHYFVRYPGG